MKCVPAKTCAGASAGNRNLERRLCSAAICVFFEASCRGEAMPCYIRRRRHAGKKREAHGAVGISSAEMAARHGSY